MNSFDAWEIWYDNLLPEDFEEKETVERDYTPEYEE